MDNQKFWNARIDEEKYLWGKEPTINSLKLIELMPPKDKLVLDLGGAYGRDSVYLAKKGFQVICADLSEKAISLGKKWAKEENVSEKIDFKLIDFFDNSFEDNSFDAIISFNFLHLFLEEKRKEIIKELARITKENGLIVFSNFSTKEAQYGKGKEYEKNTFHTKGKPVHFFGKQELTDLFEEHFKIKELTEKEIFEDHGGLKHSHIEWLLVAEKS